MLLALRLFQFTHPVWGATANGAEVLRLWEVSIHAPRVGCDTQGVLQMVQTVVFQFTHPVWGATTTTQLLQTHTIVSIHAPRVGCDPKTLSK